MAAQLHFGTGDSVTFGTTGSTTSGTASCSVSALSNVQVGDLLVAWIHSQYGSAAGTITAPSGWTAVGAAIGDPSISASRQTQFYYYTVKSATDITNLGSTLTWTFSQTGGRVGCVIARATGIDLDNPVDSAAGSFSSTNSATTFNVGGITTVNATTLLVGGYFHENSISTTSPNTTAFMTAFQEYRTNPDGTVANTGAIMGYTYLTAAGATGTVTATLDNTATTLGGELVAFVAGDWTPPVAAQLHFGTGDSVTFGTTGSSSSTTATCNTSSLSNVQVGDLLVAWIHSQAGNTVGTITPPSGWTHYGAAIGSPNISASRQTAFFYYPVKSSSDITNLGSTLTWTFSVSGGRVACVVARATGIDLDNIEDSAATEFSNAGGGTEAATIADITTVNATTLLVGGYFHENSINTASPNTTAFMTEFQEYKTNPDSTVAMTGAVLGYSYLDTAGATGSVTATTDAIVTTQGGELVAFTAGAWSPSPTGVSIRYTSAPDTLSDGQLLYTSATDTLSTPAEVRPVPTGYASVSDMLAASPFYVAHRGGSVDWPEMSLHAYTQSVFWGVGALELSLARTSDGVWFGLHDASLDRTSLNSGGGSGTTLVASAMTWAQVQNYQIQYPSVNNSSSLPQPYMRWEELMNAYYGTHVIFVDPKVAQAYTSELLNMMDAMPGTPTDHFVAKSYGQSGNTANTTGFPHDAAARGYKNWGYFYEADYENGNLATYQGRYDILGMDYTATSAAWTAVMSYGKPVIGHIVPSASGASTALGYGAAGLMVSGVQEVVPRTADPS